MVPFALRSLLFDKVRLIIALVGIAFAILLILVLRGIMDGTIAEATTYIDHSGSDIFVAQEGVEHLGLSISVIPMDSGQAAAGVEGVAETATIITVPTVVRFDGSEAAVRLVGIDPDSDLGGPWSIESGSRRPGPNAVIVDAGLAHSHDLHIGDRVPIAGHELVVEGLSSQTSTIAGSLIFMLRETAQEVLNLQDVASYVLVRVEAGSDTGEVVARLKEALPETTVLTRGQLSHNERSLLSGLFVRPVNVMSTIGFLVGLMVVGLTTYTATAERLRDFGVLKAIGASNSYLYLIVIRQALLFGSGGYALGALGSVIASYAIERFEPTLGVDLDVGFAAEVLALALVLSLISSLVPVFRISSLDPREVFAR
jgi:putative ABC transport system permease protein